MTLTADGLRAVSASYDRTLKVWELENGEPLITYYADSKTTSVAVNKKGDIVLAGDNLGRVHILRLVDCEGQQVTRRRE